MTAVRLNAQRKVKIRESINTVRESTSHIALQICQSERTRDRENFKAPKKTISVKKNRRVEKLERF